MLIYLFLFSGNKGRAVLRGRREWMLASGPPTALAVTSELGVSVYAGAQPSLALHSPPPRTLLPTPKKWVLRSTKGILKQKRHSEKPNGDVLCYPALLLLVLQGLVFCE